MTKKIYFDTFKNYTIESEQESPRPTGTSSTQSSELVKSTQAKSPAKSNLSQLIYLDYPRHVKMTMPNLSSTMTKGNIVDWKKKIGDTIKAGDVLANIETDKAQVNFEVNEEGFLAKVLYRAGTKGVDVGSVKYC